ncbi:viral A-type inclusion protein [Reticulomyxa filosa]|uniref:Viral A-type inclusion protein n=1 Tax=Reticulomyxa filosa TaxID=46433 RepID=X6NZH7_RETFI|nr:viral A-type inclusion protein [Reticulomyxa filosa]|eukprot:ETO30692.1 viral A-type inclusion protein [Reticulomyxa filosa]
MAEKVTLYVFTWEEKYNECMEREKRREEEYQLQQSSQKQMIDQLVSQLSAQTTNGLSPTSSLGETGGSTRPPLPKSVPPPPSGPSPLKKLENDYADCKKDLKRVMEKLTLKEEQIMEKQSQLESIMKQHNESNVRVTELEKENRLLTDKLETCQAKVKQSEEIRQQMADLQSKHESCNEKLSLTIQQRDDCEDKLREATKRLEEMTGQLDQLQMQCASQKGTIDELRITNHPKDIQR